MVDMEFITKTEGVYIVHRKIDGKDLVFGSFINLDEALSFRDECDEDGWLLFGNEELYSDFISNKKSDKIKKEFKSQIKINTPEPLKYTVHAPFFNIALVNDQKGTLKSGDTALQLTISDILDLIPKYESGESINDLVKEYNIERRAILERFISRYYEGDFEKYIDNFKNNKDSQYSVENQRLSKKNGKSNIPSLYKPYYNLKLSSIERGTLESNGYGLKLNIKQIKEVYDLFNKGETVTQLKKRYNCSRKLIERIINRYEEGDFDEIFKEYEIRKNSSNIKSEKPKLDQLAYRFNPFKEVTLISQSEGIIKVRERDSSFKRLPYTVEDILDISLKYSNGEKINNLIVEYGLDRLTMERLIQRYIKGDFDEVIREYKSNKFLSVQDKLTHEYNFYTPYNDLKLGSDNLSIYNNNAKLEYTIVNFLDICSDYKNCVKIKDLCRKYELSELTIERIIARYHEGDFDGIISEYKNNISLVVPDKLTDEFNFYTPFSNLSLGSDNLSIYNNNIKLNYTIDIVLDIYSDYENCVKIKDLCRKYELSELTIERIIARYHEGDFDGIISEYKNNISLVVPDKLTYDFKFYAPYNNLSLGSNEGKILQENIELNYTIDNILDIYSDYNDCIHIRDLAEKYQLSKSSIERIIARYHEGDFDEVINEFNNSKKESIIILPENLSSKYPPYVDLKLDSPYKGTLKSANAKLRFTVKDILELYNGYKNGKSVDDLKNKYNCTRPLIERTIYRYEKGDFNNVINEFNNNLSDTNGLDRLRYNNKPYAHLELLSSKEGTIKAGSAKLKFTVGEILDIYSRYKNGESIEYIAENYETTRFLIERIIFNYQKRNFDNIINEYKNSNNKSNDSKIEGKFDNNTSKSYQIEISKPYKNLKIYDTDGSIQTGSAILKLKIPDIIDIHKKSTNGYSIQKLCDEYDCSEYLIERTIYRFEKGDFNEVITLFNNFTIDENENSGENENENFDFYYLAKQNKDILDELNELKDELNDLKKEMRFIKSRII